MTTEEHKLTELKSALEKWGHLDGKAKKLLVAELSEMAAEAAGSDPAFAATCNVAANLLHSLNRYPEPGAILYGNAA